MSSQNQDVELGAFEGERGMPSVNDRGPSKAVRGAVVAGLALVAALGGGAAYWKYQQRVNKANEAEKTQAMQMGSAVPKRTFDSPPALPAASAPAEVALPAPAASAPPIPVAYNDPDTPPPPSAPPPPKLDKSESSLMTEGSSGGAAAPAPQGEGSQGGQEPAILTSANTGKRKAGHIGNRSTLLAKGSFINCVLQTRLDSTVPGMSSCSVTRNVYSDDGKVVLIERGSTVSGEYRADMKQGQSRIHVLWSRVKTPNGIVVNLDSPGADALGGGGVPGYVDTHFWKRFGGALMLSLVDDIGRYATQPKGGSNSGTMNFSTTGENMNNMAAEALKNTINIPPTLYVNQGSEVSIYVARDLDFGGVYDVVAEY